MTLERTATRGDAAASANVAGGNGATHNNAAKRGFCRRCAVRQISLCSCISKEAAGDLGRIVHRRRIPAGQLIYGGDQKSRTCAIVVSGVVKLINAKPDGRHQIVGLQFAADFLGPPFSRPSGLQAEAATDVELCCFSSSAFEALLSEHTDLERVVLCRTLDDLDMAREWMFILGRRKALEMVASLLYMIARRMLEGTGEGERPVNAGAFDLPLSRTEIAECLGLRLETVSRQFAVLRQLGLIRTAGARGFEVCDLGGLRKYSASPAD